MSRQVFERYLRSHEERRLLACVAKYGDPLARRDHAWMRLMRHTGLRVGSLAALTVEDAQEALRAHRFRVRAEAAKGGRGYQVPLNRKAEAALRDLLRIRRELGHPQTPEAPLVMSRNHRGMSIRSYQARMRMWCARADLGVQASPHWFRHTLAKRIIERSTARDPRAIVQHALGHTSIVSTAVYTWPDRDDIERAMEEAS
ncbi:MAG TPA: site-specific integrase [Gammaproteobacteria bacterium]|nr:site-specific integrase [Gammaproteobacteria bacterium]